MLLNIVCVALIALSIAGIAWILRREQRREASLSEAEKQDEYEAKQW